MKPDNIIDAIGNIDEKYIDEGALDKAPKKTSPLRWILPLAACIAFVIAAVLLFPKADPAPADSEREPVLQGEESSKDESSSEDISLEESSEDTPIPIEKLLWSGRIDEGVPDSNLTSSYSTEKLSDDITVMKSFYKYLTEEVADDEFVAFGVRCVNLGTDTEAIADIREQRQSAEALYKTLLNMWQELYLDYEAKGINDGEIRAKILSDPEYAAAYETAYDACIAVAKAELDTSGELGEEYIKHLQSKGFKLLYGVENEECEAYLHLNGFVAVMAGTKEQFLALKNDEVPGKMLFCPAYEDASQLNFGFSYGIEPYLPPPAEFTEEGLTAKLAELYTQSPDEKLTVRIYYNLRYPTKEEAYERGWRSLGYESKADYERDLNADLLDVYTVQQCIMVQREAMNGKREKQAVIDRVLKEGELFDTEAAGIMVTPYLRSNCVYANLSYERALEVAADEAVAYIEIADFNYSINPIDYSIFYDIQTDEPAIS